MGNRIKADDSVDYRSMLQYSEGFAAFKKYGSPDDACPNGPYANGDRKTAWLVGWLDARTEAKLG